MRQNNRQLMLLAAVLMVGSACAEYTPELWISSNKLLEAGSCQPSDALANTGATLLNGVLDVEFASQYAMNLAIRSTLASSNSVTIEGGGQAGVTSAWEANEVQYTRLEVSISSATPLGVALPKRTIELSGSVRPGASVLMSLPEVLDSAMVNALRESPLLAEPGDEVNLRLRVRLYGRTMGNRSVDSNEFTFPVRVCRGCLFVIPPAAIDADFGSLNCRNFANFQDDSCYLGQDVPLDCRVICPLLIDRPGADPFGYCEPAGF